MTTALRVFHTLDNDSRDWECIQCGRMWADGIAFLWDSPDCEPAWMNRELANERAPIVWAGMDDAERMCA